jgi:hypothetical protein
MRREGREWDKMRARGRVDEKGGKGRKAVA